MTVAGTGLSCCHPTATEFSVVFVYHLPVYRVERALVPFCSHDYAMRQYDINNNSSNKGYSSHGMYEYNTRQLLLVPGMHHASRSLQLVVLPGRLTLFECPHLRLLQLVFLISRLRCLLVYTLKKKHENKVTYCTLKHTNQTGLWLGLRYKVGVVAAVCRSGKKTRSRVKIPPSFVT